MKDAWIVFTVFVFFDCMQSVVNGMISGLGIASDVKWITSIAYWVVGIPLSSVLVFHYKMSI